MEWRRSLNARKFQRFSNRNCKGVHIMILLKHPTACVASAAATLLGAIVLAGPLFAASGNFSQAAGTKSTAAHEVIAQAASPEAMASPAPAATASEPAGTASVEARITELHKRLRVSDAQKPQWDSLAQVMRDNAQAMADLQKQRAADVKSMNAVDAVKSYGSVIEAHDAGMKKFIPAFEALYNTMSDAQKKIADSLFRSRVRAAAKKEAKESK